MSHDTLEINDSTQPQQQLKALAQNCATSTVSRVGAFILCVRHDDDFCRAGNPVSVSDANAMSCIIHMYRISSGVANAKAIYRPDFKYAAYVAESCETP
jgi:hypothetical protein